MEAADWMVLLAYAGIVIARILRKRSTGICDIGVHVFQISLKDRAQRGRTLLDFREQLFILLIGRRRRSDLLGIGCCLGILEEDERNKECSCGRKGPA